MMSLKIAIKILKSGGVVAYPTDTAYGLGADSENEKAVLKIFKIKGRKKEKSLPLIAGNIKIVKKYAKLDEIFFQLAKKYWPGPLTLVLYPTALAKRKFAKQIFQNGKMAIRVPDCDIARKLSKALGRPITSTSANISGEPMCYSQKQIKEHFKGRKYQLDYILDGGQSACAGRLKKSKPSTIIEVQNGKIVILRKGGIKIKLN